MRDGATSPRILRAVGVREHEVVEPRHEPGGRRRLGIRQWRARQVVEHLPLLVPERPQREPVERLGDRRQARNAGPLADVLLRRRAVGAQVPANEVVEGLPGRRRLPLQPCLGGCVDAVPAVAPDAGRRHVHDARVTLHAPPEERRRRRPAGMWLQQRAHLLERALARRELREDELRQLRQPRFRDERLVGGRPEDAAELAAGGRERPVVARRDDVERAALQQRLHEAAARERLRQLLPLESLEPSPEREIRARCRLRLKAAEPLDGLHRAAGPPLEQQLAGEQRAVQLAPSEDPFAGHRVTLTADLTQSAHAAALGQQRDLGGRGRRVARRRRRDGDDEAGRSRARRRRARPAGPWSPETSSPHGRRSGS